MMDPAGHGRGSGGLRRSEVGVCGRILVFVQAMMIVVMFSGVEVLAQAQLGDENYRVKVGDQIRFTVPDRPSMNREFTVDENGVITPALVGGIHVEGLTSREIHEKVYEALIEYYPSLKITDFSVEPIPGVVVYVTGEVAAPGRYVFGTPPTLWAAIREAGGPTGEAALDVVRVVSDESLGGTTETVNVLSAIEQGTTEGLPTVKDGDTIVILSTAETYIGAVGVTVAGEVLKPGFYRLQGEHQDLMSAIMLAGGPDSKASLGSVKIIRHLETGETVTLSVNLKEYLDKGNLENNPNLLPGDTVSVPAQNAWSYQIKNNFGIILSVIATAATVILVIDRTKD